jgi:hypothetical protein
LESLHNSSSDFYGPQNTQNDAESLDRMSRIYRVSEWKSGNVNRVKPELCPIWFCRCNGVGGAGSVWEARTSSRLCWNACMEKIK